ncbi:Tropinone reductase like [Dissostichus eleginoides]|uniref:Tropinone reductase like n=2 Tax=Dissostichus eleginoides TaxID=100907 RepID=A0AAD9FCV6_DISEL|nr:Tropinone reductase like [Dissostichus eleginoides]
MFLYVPLAANSQDQQHLNDISWNTRRLGSVGETLTASDGRDQGGRGHFTQLMGPTTPRNEHVFRPTFRVGGDSGPIPCTAAELHGLLLLENIKQQVNQLAGTLNILMAKVGSGLHAPTYEMPEEFQFPLDSDGELERFEEWLRNPLNERMKTDLATSLSSVGGVDTKRVVWNILARMITCTVARRINWKGVNGKRAFSKMAMKIVLFRAVRKCAITSAAMDADISQHTIRWFNLASDREGGRQERQERRRQSQDTLPVPDGQY